MEQEIYMWLVSILPSATSIIAILFAAFKIIKEFVALRKDVNCREELRQIIKENNNLAEWSRQVEECRTSGLSVRSWCEQHQIAVSTFHYRQQRVWKALQKSSQFVEVPLSFDESHNDNIAASVKVGSICAEVHNGADEATLAALFRALKSC
jgi:hypothetical protein